MKIKGKMIILMFLVSVAAGVGIFFLYEWINQESFSPVHTVTEEEGSKEQNRETESSLTETNAGQETGAFTGTDLPSETDVLPDSEKDIMGGEKASEEGEASGEEGNGSSGTDQAQEGNKPSAGKTTKEQAEEILASMTLEEKVAQMFFVTPESLTGYSRVTAAGETTRKALSRCPVGGIVYFAQNLADPGQTAEMLENVQAYAMEKRGLPLFLGVDEEGGRVLRIGSKESFGVERVEAMGKLAEAQDEELIYRAGDTIGAYLAELGFNVDFAPDADVLDNENNQVIGDRSFGTDPDTVASMAWRFAEGLHHNNMLAVYKHFPGHGGTVEDSHSGYAYVYKTMDELRRAELIPFQDGSDRGIDFIMVSHVSAPEASGDNTPASLSGFFVTRLLREEMGYEGIIITDSMSMGAITKHYSAAEAALGAIEAGCDMVLMPQDLNAAYSAVLQAVKEEQIPKEQIEASVRRIIAAKLRWMQGT